MPLVQQTLMRSRSAGRLPRAASQKQLAVAAAAKSPASAAAADARLRLKHEQSPLASRAAEPSQSHSARTDPHATQWLGATSSVASLREQVSVSADGSGSGSDSDSGDGGTDEARHSQSVLRSVMRQQKKLTEQRSEHQDLLNLPPSLARYQREVGIVDGKHGWLSADAARVDVRQSGSPAGNRHASDKARGGGQGDANANADADRGGDSEPDSASESLADARRAASSHGGHPSESAAHRPAMFHSVSAADMFRTQPQSAQRRDLHAATAPDDSSFASHVNHTHGSAPRTHTHAYSHSHSHSSRANPAAHFAPSTPASYRVPLSVAFPVVSPSVAHEASDAASAAASASADTDTVSPDSGMIGLFTVRERQRLLSETSDAMRRLQATVDVLRARPHSMSEQHWEQAKVWPNSEFTSLVAVVLISTQ